MKTTERAGEGLPRRRFLGVFAAACGTAAVGSVLGALGSLAGCAPGDGDGAEGAAPEPLRVPLDRLAMGERTRVTVDGVPVELLRTEEGVTARSLRCTHFGCTVAWSPERDAYVCPCHDGMFGPGGRVIYGPPDAPLPTLPVERDGDAVVIRPLPRASAGGAGEAAP